MSGTQAVVRNRLRGVGVRDREWRGGGGWRGRRKRDLKKTFYQIVVMCNFVPAKLVCQFCFTPWKCSVQTGVCWGLHQEVAHVGTP